MSAIACCHEGCGASVCFTPEIERRLRTSHEDWMCPFGHVQFFAAKTDAERRVEQAEQHARVWEGMWGAAEEAFGSCPFCDWRSYAHHTRRWGFMFRHFVKVHPDIIPPRALMALYRAKKERAA